VSPNSTRDDIVRAADRLFYQQGFEHTSFADIADAVQISRGNFYYHFKSKDDILAAVIDQRLVETQQMLDGWEEEGEDPAVRIRYFVRMWLNNQADIRDYGCPVGTLCAELSKVNHDSLDDAKELFMLFRIWLRERFIELGRTTDADQLAMHLLAQSQGVAMLANAFHDKKFIKQEVAEMEAWLEAVIGETERR
jgi:TetR/AcrR family transcriptional regulator, transcriptional repressor for nem operon